MNDRAVTEIGSKDILKIPSMRKVKTQMKSKAAVTPPNFLEVAVTKVDWLN